MARTAKPWWRDDRQAWFVTIRGERHNLGPDKSEADRRFHQLMAATPEPKPKSRGLSVADVFEKFLDWCQKHREPRTYEWYRDHIQNFVTFLEHPAGMPVASLRPFHVVEWVDAHPTWSDTFRRGAIIAVQRPFNWAEELGYVESSPVKKIKKPQAKRREKHVTAEQWPSIRDHYAEGDPFRDLLEFAWETGCRPQEASRAEARHLEPEQQRLAFPPAEAKGKKRWRFVYLTKRAAEIVVRLARQHPVGPLFRNGAGRPWTVYATSCRFKRLTKHLGVKFCSYALRHGFATRKLEGGLDHITVAALMGHADGTMLARVYSHINERHDHLREQLSREGLVDG